MSSIDWTRIKNALRNPATLVLLVFTLLVLIRVIGIAISGAAVEFDNYEYSLDINATSNDEEIRVHIVFDEHKPVICRDGILVTTGNKIVHFRTENELHVEGTCVETDIIFDNIIYQLGANESEEEVFVTTEDNGTASNETTENITEVNETQVNVTEINVTANVTEVNVTETNVTETNITELNESETNVTETNTTNTTANESNSTGDPITGSAILTGLPITGHAVQYSIVYTVYYGKIDPLVTIEEKTIEVIFDNETVQGEGAKVITDEPIPETALLDGTEILSPESCIKEINDSNFKFKADCSNSKVYFEESLGSGDGIVYEVDNKRVSWQLLKMEYSKGSATDTVSAVDKSKAPVRYSETVTSTDLPEQEEPEVVSDTNSTVNVTETNTTVNDTAENVTETPENVTEESSDGDLISGGATAQLREELDIDSDDSFEVRPPVIFEVEAENKIKYSEAFDGVDVEYTYEYTKLKEDIVLNDTLLPTPEFIPDTLDFVFSLDYDESLTIYVDREPYTGGEVETDNRVVFRDGRGILSYFVRPYAYDGAGARVDAKYKIKTVDGETFLTVAVPYGWLADEARVRPITIDPTMSSATYAVSEVVALGGGKNTAGGGGRNVSFTIGEPAIGISSAASYVAELGFYYSSFDTTGPVVGAPTFNVTQPSTSYHNISVTSVVSDDLGIASCTFAVTGATTIGSATMTLTNSTINYTQATASAVITSLLNEGTHTVTVTCTDTTSNTGQNSANLITNSAPTHDTPILTTTDTTLNSTLENLTAINVSFADANGDALTAIYDWRLNGTSIAVLNLPFDTNNATGTKDYSLYRNHGTITDPTNNVTWQSGTTCGLPNSGGCYDFDGTDDFIDLSSSVSSLNFDSNASLSFWFRGTTDSCQSVYSISQVGAAQEYFTVHVGDGCTGSLTNELIMVNRDDGGVPTDRLGYTTATRSELFDGNWHHVVLTWNLTDTTTSIYLDGDSKTVTVGTGSDSGRYGDISGADAVHIGTLVRSTGDCCYLDGELDNVQVYDRAISTLQVSTIYNSGLPKYNVTVSDETLVTENWSVAVTPSDENRDGITKISNNVTILDATPPSVTVDNVSIVERDIEVQTEGEPDTNTVDPVFVNETLSFNVTASDDIAIDSVWVVIWENVIDGVEKVRTFLSNITGNFWGALLGIDDTYTDSVYNYSVFANDTTNNTIQVNGTFLVNHRPTHDTPLITTTDTTTNDTLQNLTALNQSFADTEGNRLTAIYDWRLNGNSITVLNMPFDSQNSSGVRGYSLYANSGTITGATWRNETDCGLAGGGGCYQFDGSNDYITVDSSQNDELDMTDNFSIEFWYKFTTTANRVVIERSNVNTHYGVQTGIATCGTDELTFFTSGGASNRVCTTSNVNDGNWHHFVATYVGGTGRVYTDGNLEDEVTGMTDPASSNNDLLIGSRSGSVPWPGHMNELRLYDRVLTLDQVSANYNDGLPRYNITVFNMTIAGENWSVAVTPNDAKQSGLTKISANLTVAPGPAPPTHDTPILNTTDITRNDTNQNLTAYNVSFADVNSDALTAIYDWRINGTSIAVLNMPFDTENTTGVTDYSTYENNGDILDGSNNVTWKNETICGLTGGGGCYEFDGVNDYIRVSHSEELDSEELTLEVWVRLTDLSTSRDNTIFGKRANDNSDFGAYMLWVSEQNTDGDVRFTTFHDSCAFSDRTRLTSNGDGVQDNEWHHIVATLNSSHQAIFIDGELNVTQSYTDGLCVTRTDDLHIGSRGHHINDEFEGFISGARIYNRSLTPNQIRVQYNSGIPRYNLTVANETVVTENWSVAVTPNDGTFDGITKISNNVTILDATDPTVIIDNVSSVERNLEVNDSEPAFINETLSFNVTASDDVEIDAVWLVIWETVINGAEKVRIFLSNITGNFWGVLVGTNDTFTSSLYNYSIFANDTSNNTIQVNGTFIVNHRPTHAKPIINTTDFTLNTSGVNITIANVSFADSDGDSLSAIYDWRVNGDSITVINMPFDSKNLTGVRDYSTYRNDGTINEANWLNSSECGLGTGGCYSFDGSDDYITLGDVDDSEGSGTVTVATWAYLPAGVNHDTVELVASKFDGTDAPFQMLACNGTENNGVEFGVFFEDSTGSLSRHTADSVATTGAWSFVTLVLNSSESTAADRVKLYVNAALQSGSGTATACISSATTGFDLDGVMDNNNGDLVIGGRDNGASYGNIFEGYIDNFQFYNRALTQTQIETIYNEGAPLYNVTYSNETVLGENWSVAVTPNDGWQDGITKISNNVTIVTGIANEVPTHDTPILNTTDITLNDTLQNLTAYNVSFADSDGDAMTAIYDWRLNGTSVTALNMPFDTENSTGSKDYSTYGNDGTVSGATWKNSTICGLTDSGGCYDFDGDDLIQTGVDILSPSTSVGASLELWFKSTDSTSDTVMFSVEGYYILFLNRFSTGSVVAIFDGSSGANNGDQVGTNLNDGNWHHFVATTDGSTTRLYVDGFLNNSYAETMNDLTGTSRNTGIGGQWNGADTHFTGSLDNARLHNRTLTLEQIRENYNMGVPKYNVTAFNETVVGENWSVAVTPNDGTADGITKISNNVTILDATSPTVVVDNVSSVERDVTVNATEPAFINETLSFNVTVTDDVEVDAVWLVIWENVINGVEKVRAFLSNITGNFWGVLNQTNDTFTDSLYNFSIFANDSSNNTIQVNGTFIVNHRPTHDTPLVTTTDLTANDTLQNLTALNQSFADADGDALTAIYDWRLNGSSIALINMPFDTENTTGVKDYSTNRLDGTLQGPTWNNESQCIEGGCYFFDGSSDYIDMTSHISTLEGKSAGTISLWFKSGDTSTDNEEMYSISDKDTNANYFVFGVGDVAGAYSDESLFFFLTRDNTLRLEFYARNGHTAYKDQQWHHLVVVTGDGNNTLYADGVRQEITFATGSASTNEFSDISNADTARIGARDIAAFDRFTHGNIDGFQVFDRPLSIEQVQAIYDNGAPRYNITVSNETILDENWSVAVTPNDGYQDGLTKISNNVTILETANQAPTHDTPILNTTDITENDTTDNLTVLNQSFSDANGDAMTAIYDWRINGTSVAIVNYPFDTQNSTNAKDYSTYARDATNNGATWTSGSACRLEGGCYEFDGSSDYMTTPSMNTGFTQSAFTLEAWINTTETSNTQRIISATQSMDTFLRTNSGGVQCAAKNGGFSGQTVEAAGIELVADGAWHHLICTFDGSDLAIYVDGVEKNTTTGLTTPDADTVSWYIGRYPLSAVEHFDGYLDNIKIYNRSLSAGTVSSIYNSGVPNYTFMHSNETVTAENWTVAVTPNDGQLDGTTKISNTVTINVLKSIAIGISNALSGGINWSVTNLSKTADWNATGNNHAGETDYNVSIQSEGTNVDVFIRASGNLTRGGGVENITLDNQKFTNSTSDRSVDGIVKSLFTKLFTDNRVAESVTSGSNVHLKFFLNVPGSTGAGSYVNNVTIKAIEEGEAP